MELFNTKSDLRQFVNSARQAGQVIGLVPTMGAIHYGHQTLVKRALKSSDCVIVSVFVNPTQFAPGEDYEAYPRTLDSDVEKLAEAGASAIFAPSVEEMYGKDLLELFKASEDIMPFDKFSHAVPGSAKSLWEGINRPTHFEGVTTIVSKLFNIVRPDIACFGEKDFQQLAVIRQMVDQMDFGIEIIGCPIAREADGLAISSRNIYMNTDERTKALCLSKSLKQAASMLEEGCREAKTIINFATKMIEESGMVIDYVAIVDASTLEPLDSLEGKNPKDCRMILAAKIGDVRLIDNASLCQFA